MQTAVGVDREVASAPTLCRLEKWADRATAVRLPSSPARGPSRRIGPASGAQASLKTPLATIAHIPTCHACRAAASNASGDASAEPRAARNAGPITKNTMPNVLGVSRPSGIAVTSVRPLRRASPSAIQVKARSPNTTPIAVPGTKCDSAKEAG